MEKNWIEKNKDRLAGYAMEILWENNPEIPHVVIDDDKLIINKNSIDYSGQINGTFRIVKTWSVESEVSSGLPARPIPAGSKMYAIEGMGDLADDTYQVWEDVTDTYDSPYRNSRFYWNMN